MQSTGMLSKNAAYFRIHRVLGLILGDAIVQFVMMIGTDLKYQKGVDAQYFPKVL